MFLGVGNKIALVKNVHRKHFVSVFSVSVFMATHEIIGNSQHR